MAFTADPHAILWSPPGSVYTRRPVISTLLLCAALGVAGHNQQAPDTLGDLVKRIGYDTAGLPADLIAARVANYLTIPDDPRRSVPVQTHGSGDPVMAFYVDLDPGRITPPLYVAVREPGRPWNLVTIEAGNAAAENLGSLHHLRLTGQFVVVETHLSPSAASTIVIHRERGLVGRFYGWVVHIVLGDVLVLQRSMVHFAPAHQGELAVFDAGKAFATALYRPASSPRGAAFVNRMRPVVADLENRKIPSGSYGWNPEWFDISFSEFTYDPRADALTFHVRFASRTPAPVLEDRFTVVCRPMRAASRQCAEKGDAR